MSVAEIIASLLSARGLVTPVQQAEFLHPQPPHLLPSPFASSAVSAAVDLIVSHLSRGSRIAVYGDYDVDGVCSTAIIWETLTKLPAPSEALSLSKGEVGATIIPYLPQRQEGYGLSRIGIDNCLDQGAGLIIAVDNGVTAFDQVVYCRSRGCDIIIIDHHEPGDRLPDANCLLHHTGYCAAALSWFFAREFKKNYLNLFPSPQLWRGGGEVESEVDPHLELVALATICDIIPLTGANRIFAKFGLENLSRTSRPGLLALYEVSGIKKLATGNWQLKTYEIGFLVGPRLNASGRLTHALDSLRLICTTDPARAMALAKELDSVNRERQQLTESAVSLAVSRLTDNRLTDIILVSDPTFDPGVIGLVAAKLVEKFHRPAIAAHIDGDLAKGSVRSVPGFDVTAHLRRADHLFTSLGGHSMAAGFSLPTIKLEDLKAFLSNTHIDPQLLVKKNRVDLDMPLHLASWDLYFALKELEPFGLGNPQPVFKSECEIISTRTMGSSGQHLKLNVKSISTQFPSPQLRRGVRGEVVGTKQSGEHLRGEVVGANESEGTGPARNAAQIVADGVETFEAVWFNFPSPPVRIGDKSEVVYTLSENTWNGRTSLQLLIRDFKPTKNS